MKFILVSIFLFFLSITQGQDSLDIIVSTKEKILSTIKTDRMCNIRNFKLVVSHYIDHKKLEELNDFLSLVYENDPKELEFQFHQEITDLSLVIISHLNKKNKSSFNNYYRTLRFRFFKAFERQQKILLAKAALNFNSNQMEDGYSSLTEVMRMDEAKILSKGERNLYKRDLSYEYAFEAYISFLQHLSVDDVRFKMLVKHSRYSHYINHRNQYAYRIINDKLSKAGYKAIKPKSMLGKNSDSDVGISIEEQKEREKKENEKFKKKYDWIKKE